VENREIEGKKRKIPIPSKGVNIGILVFIALVFMSSVFLRPLQLKLRSQMESVRNGFISSVEESWGLKIQYRSIGPSIFGVLDIRDIKILREDDSVFLSMSRLRLSFSLSKFIRGDIYSAFKSIRIDKPVLNYDFEKDADLNKRIASLFEPGSPEQKNTQNFRELLPEEFSMKIWNGEWEIADSFGRLKLSNAGFDAAVKQNRLSFQGRWRALASLATGAGPLAVFSPPSSKALEALLTGRISGEYLADLEEGSATVTIPSITGDNYRVKPISFNFFLSDKQLEVRKVFDKSPMSFFLVYNFGDESILRGRFEGKNFSPDAMLSFSGSWRDYNPLLAFQISGAADFKKENSGILEFNADFSGAGRKNTILENALLGLKIFGTSDHVTVDTFQIRSPFGDLGFRGGVNLRMQGNIPFGPYGALSLSDFRFRGDSGISGDLLLRTQGQGINIWSDNLVAGSTELSALDISLNWEREGVIFGVSALTFNDGSKDFRQNPGTRSISLSGSADYYPRQIQAKCNLDSFSMGDILSFVEPFYSIPLLQGPGRLFAEDFSVTTEAFITTDYSSIIYNAPHLVASYNGFVEILAIASVSGTSRGINLDNGLVSWQDGSAEVSGSLDYTNPDDIFFTLGATVKNLTYFFDGMVREKRNVNIRGSYGFQVFLSTSETGLYTGYAKGDNMPLLSGDNFASLNFLLSIAYDSPSFWRARIEKFEITGLTTPASRSAVARLTGSADETGLSIQNIFYDDGQGVMGGNVSVSWDSAYSNYRFMAELSAPGRSEYYHLNGTYIDKKLELLLSGQKMQFSRFTRQNAVVDGSFKLSWESIASFEADVILLSCVLYNRNETLRISASANMNNDRFVAQKMRISYSGLEVGIPYFSVDRSVSLLGAEAWVWGLFAERPVDITMHAAANFNSSSTWVDLLRNFDSVDISLLVDSIRFSTMESSSPFAFNFSARQDNLGYEMRLRGGPGYFIDARYNTRAEGGTLNAILSGPSPVKGTFSALIESGNIEGRAEDVYVDLGSLWRFLPPSIVIAFPEGIVTAAVRVSGPLEAPNFFGSAHGTGLHMMIPEFLPLPIKPVPVTAYFNETEIVFGPVDAIVGNGAGRVSGWFRFDQWIPSIFNIDIRVPPETPIPYGFDISGVLSRGMASGRLIVSMENLILSVTGDLVASNTQISINVIELMEKEAEEFQEIEDGKVSVVVDLSIQAGRRVEFFWPSVDFPIIQAYADMGTGIQVAFDAKDGSFNLLGDVNLRGGEIFYLERNFYIREGTIFFKENETSFDPRISARAEIRDLSDIGPVTISMIIDNAPLRSFTPRFVSTPPLSQLEIYAILGKNPQGDEGRDLATSVLIDSLAQSMIINRLQRQVRDFLGLDMLSVRTQLLQNFVYQAAGGQLFSNTVDNPYRAGNYFDNTTIFMGKYFGMDLFGEAMLSFKYDETKPNWGGMVIEPEFGFELRNPLFDIRLNVNPMHPENLFIDDISFSLLWRKSF